MEQGEKGRSGMNATSLLDEFLGREQDGTK